MKIIKDKPKSLIMCVTPLQMLIAEKIIELNSNQSFDLLVVALNDNEKYRMYFNRIKKICTNSLYYIQGKRRLVFFDYISELRRNNLNVKYQYLYLASIDSRHFQYIVSKNKFSSLYTFDDGTANIVQSSLYYLNSKPHFLKRSIWRILGIKYYMKDLKDNSLLHYTIYKDIPNIIENKQYITLFSTNNDNNQDGMKEEVVSFYLGQPLIDISEKFNVQYVQNSIKKLKIDYYYPHPRENVYPKGDFKIIESPMIFEDYIIDFLKNNPNINLNVFSFTSTSILNIIDLDRVKVSYIHNSEIFELNRSFYELAQKSFNIPHLDLDRDFLS